VKRIAITGGIAEGKSTVLGYCKEAGYSVCSADDIAKAIFHETALQDRLAELFDLEPPVETADVRRLIAGSDFLRRSLNQLTHRAIMDAMMSCRAQVNEVPLLIESCIQGEFDRIWVVTCGELEQRKRLEARLGQAEAAHLLATQLPSRVKTAFADTVIRTNQPENHVQAFVLACLSCEFG